MIEAVIFDLDGVILDSEPIWDGARREVADEFGGRWTPDATASMQGMSSLEWSAYLRQPLGVSLSEEQIVDAVVDKVLRRYAAGLPLVHRAVEAVERIGARWKLGLASSSNRVVIDTVLELTGLRRLFEVAVSSEELPRGKPWPDVYLDAARRLGVLPTDCCAIEDSANGIRSAAAAGMAVVAVPNPRSIPSRYALNLAGVVAPTLDDVTADTILRAYSALHDRVESRLDEAEDESFPASDPHADWAGPPC